MSCKNFYNTRQWLDLRYRVLRHYPRKCMCCNSRNKRLNVDHIKPRSIYPELELDFSNMQILCSECNRGKSNKYSDDFRCREKPIRSKLKNKNLNKGVYSSLPPGEGCYLFHKTKPSRRAHLWDGCKVVCDTRLGSAKDMIVSDKLDSENRKVCLRCIEVSTHQS